MSCTSQMIIYGTNEVHGDALTAGQFINTKNKQTNSKDEKFDDKTFNNS